MSDPKPDAEGGQRAHLQELRRVGRPIRLSGFAMIMVGAGLLVAPHLFRYNPPQWSISGGYALIAFGWLLFLIAIFMRTRYQRRRMAAAKAERGA